MYQKVLIPLDGSKEAEDVYARIEGDLAPDCDVALLRVIPPCQTRRIGEHVLLASQQEDAERFRVNNYLAGILRKLGGDTDRWSCNVVVSGSVPQGIVDFAQSAGVDLIAMYTHDRKGLARVIRGNNAKEVQRTAPVDVRLLRVADLEEREPEQIPAPPAAPAESTASAPAGLDSETVTPRITADSLRDVDLFGDLSAYQIDSMASIGEPVSVSEGEVFGEGDESEQYLYVIVEGEAQLAFQTGVGAIPVRVAGQGDSFPLAALLGPGTLITTGKALTPMEVLALPISSLLDLCAKDTEIGMRVYREAAQLFADRYSDTLEHLARSTERELRGLA